jgi:Tubulin like/zinc-ribbon domain
MAVEEKLMVPTLLVGVGGTGYEVLSRVRRLTEEVYGKLDNFPILGFLAIDTDKDPKVTNPEAAGSAFLDHEKFHASVSGTEVRNVMSDMQDIPWIASWFPSELERNIDAIEAGANQIRACGRFALFRNYHNIQEKFRAAISRIKGHETMMLNNYQVKVETDNVNIFVVGSLSGGTGSGMIIDMGYCIRHWLKGQTSSQVTAIVPMPNAFKNVQVGDRVLANGYAALMELSYFSDHRNEYSAQFSGSLNDEIKSKSTPFDFTYLVGTKNGEVEFGIEQIREIISQNIFLDLTSEFAPYKRSIRDNIKGAWAQNDPLGIGYPKNFMSVGLATVEIPISLIRTSLTHRLATHFIEWWQNKSASSPPDMAKLVQGDNFLKGMRLTEPELLSALAYGNEKTLLNEVSDWIGEIRQEIVKDNKLQCTKEGLNVFRESGKILQFIEYIQPKVKDFRQTRLREESQDPRMHGSYHQKMYSNRDKIVNQGLQALEAKFYEIVADRNYGIEFAKEFLNTVRQYFDTVSGNFIQVIDGTQPTIIKRDKQYIDALAEISQFRDKFAATKKTDMEVRCAAALEAIEALAIATIQRKTRQLGIEVIQRLQEKLNDLGGRLTRLNQKLQQFGDGFKAEEERQANRADSLVVNGIKLYNRDELNALYNDMIEQLAGTSEGYKSRYKQGINNICSNLSQEILKTTSQLWKINRRADEVMQFFDIPMLTDVQYSDFQDIIIKLTRKVIQTAPNSSRLKRELAAADRLFKVYNNDELEIRHRLGMTQSKSQALIVFNKAELDKGGFVPKKNNAVAIIGGSNNSDPAAKKLVPMLKDRVGQGNINPLGDNERHRIIFVQEVGGFSLRCIEGMRELQQSYQDWKGQVITAKRARMKGQAMGLPIPVHIQKEPPFWDIFPENQKVFELVTISRALGIMRADINNTNNENVIRYYISTATDNENNVDIASTWEEATQALEIPACRQDLEEIERQKKAKLDEIDSTQKKQQLYQQLLTYLDRRKLELDRFGGKESYQYLKEKDIIDRLIETQQLLSNPTIKEEISQVPPTIGSTHRFCTNCGHQNLLAAKFCSECGHGLN